MNLKDAYGKLKISKKHSLNLHTLLEKMPEINMPLNQRVRWLDDIITWISTPSFIEKTTQTTELTSQKDRLKLLMFHIDINEDLKAKFGKCISSILIEAKSIPLFCGIGLADQDSLFLDLSQRINHKILPQLPEYNNLAYIIKNNFNKTKDTLWFIEMRQELKQFILSSMKNENQLIANHFKNEGAESIVIITSQIMGIALQSDMRKRMRSHSLPDNPFYRMGNLSQQFLQWKTTQEFDELSKQIKQTCEEALLFLQDVHTYLDQFGVDLNIVYKLEKIENQLNRINRILNLVSDENNNLDNVLDFIEILIIESIRKRSVIALVRDSSSLLARKITERNAETGEHYIARNSNDFNYLFNKALGGGFLTAFTVWFKFLIATMQLTGFGYGVLASLNYCIGFLGIQALGFTLATKQPATTAPVLADKMQNIDDKNGLNSLCDEIIHLVRSQTIAVMGNILAVVPTIAVMWAVLLFCFNVQIADKESAVKNISSFSIFGMTPFYAAFTGVLLFSSSIVAGWFDNWFAYHQLEPAITANRRIQFLFGEKGAEKIAKFCKKNIVGITSNISIAFFLGMTPSIGYFFSLPLDVRHVTLSSGALTASALQIGAEVFWQNDFWFAVLGVISMAFLNIGVSFSLAMFIAMRAKKISSPKFNKIYKAMFWRIYANPMLLFYPQKTKD